MAKKKKALSHLRATDAPEVPVATCASSPRQEGPLQQGSGEDGEEESPNTATSSPGLLQGLSRDDRISLFQQSIKNEVDRQSSDFSKAYLQKSKEPPKEQQGRPTSLEPARLLRRATGGNFKNPRVNQTKFAIGDKQTPSIIAICTCQSKEIHLLLLNRPSGHEDHANLWTK
uniref:Uncharacterized protein n=1 Tax=Sphaerodactylus townsendi TaxID=933632 RepID=A0ACB8F375_9SAUR